MLLWGFGNFTESVDSNKERFMRFKRKVEGVLVFKAVYGNVKRKATAEFKRMRNSSDSMESESACLKKASYTAKRLVKEYKRKKYSIRSLIMGLECEIESRKFNLQALAWTLSVIMAIYVLDPVGLVSEGKIARYCLPAMLTSKNAAAVYTTLCFISALSTAAYISLKALPEYNFYKKIKSFIELHENM